MGHILKYIRLALLAPATGIVSILWVLIPLTSPANPKWTSYAAQTLRLIGRFVLGYRIDVENNNNFDIRHVEKSVIISNHQSNFDIFHVGEVCPRNCVSVGKKALASIPIFGQMYWLTGNILIDRGNRKRAWSVMDKVVDKIKEGANVWIMPEGTRSKGRGLLPFKKGPFVVAIKAQRPIYPICIGDFDKVVDLTRWNSGTLKMKILPPISTEGKTLDDLNELKEEIRSIMEIEIAKLS